MKSIYLLLILPILLNVTCMKTRNLTSLEKEIIMGAPSDTPFYVLQTTNENDSIFLREKATDIILEDMQTPEFNHLIARMCETLIHEKGVGLAAPQVGIGRNIFLFMRLDKPEAPIEVAINPRIVSHSPEQICFERDGCLSIPGISGNTLRYDWVEVEYYNIQGEKINEVLKSGSRGGDFTGVIFQHEFDHLNGVLFIDRLIENQ